MKIRLLKNITMLILSILILNNFGAIANAVVKTEKTGFKINIEYDNTGANLSGDTTQVLDNIMLKSIKDEFGNEYNPYKFEKHIQEDGEYKYLLTWEYINEKKSYEEEISILVEKNNFLKEISLNTNVEDDNNEVHIPNVSFRETRSITSIQNAVSSQANTHTLDTYASESAWSLNKQITFDGGYFADNDIFLNSLELEGRIFETAYIISKDSNQKIEISGLFSITEGGKTYKYYVDKKEAGADDPTIAYELKDTDTIHAYFKLKNQTDYRTIITNIPDEWDALIKPNQLDKILVGSKVVVSYKPTSNYLTPGITISTNGEKVEITEEKSEDANSKTFSFIMPSSTVTIEYTGTKQALERKVGLQIGMNGVFQKGDTGFATLWMDPTHYNTTPIYRNFETKQKFDPKYTFGTEISRGRNAYFAKKYNDRYINGIANYNDNANSNYNNGTQNLIPSSDMINGGVYTGISSTNSSRHGGHALASFEQGATLEFNLIGSRGKWSSSGINKAKLDYRYIPNSSIEIKIFPNSDTLETDTVKNLTIPLFQDKKSYDEQIANGDLDINEPGVQNGVTIANNTNGLYPVITKLENGMEFICYQKNHDENGNPGRMETSPKAKKFDFTIKVKNAVDSFLISAGFTPESQQWYQLKTNLDAFQTDDKGAIIEAFNFKDTNKYQRITDGKSLVLGNNRANMYDFRMKIKPGYSYPYIYITDFKNKILPETLNEGDITTQNKDQLGRWWVDFNPNGNSTKLISDTIGVENTPDGFYHVRVNAILNHPHGSYPLYLKSVPIQFSYDFNEMSNGTGKSLSSGNNVNVKDNKYFNIPYSLPNSNVNKEYFQGWKLQVELGDKTNKEITNKDGSYFNPGDLIDITYIAETLQKEFGISDVGKESYHLSFTPVYIPTIDNAKYRIGKWERIYQDSYTTMSDNTGKSIYVLPNKLLYMTYKSKLTNPNNLQGTYLLGLDSKVSGKLVTDQAVFANFNYYKVLNVNYMLDLPDGVDANPVTDTNLYTSMDIKPSNASPKVDELKHIIKLNPITTKNNTSGKQFIGWQLVDSSGTALTKEMFNPNETIDLTQIKDQAVQSEIFKTGMINLKAVWGNTVKIVIVHGDNSNASTKKSHQIIYTDEDLVLTSKFKYVNTDTSASSISLEEVKSYLKYAVLKKNPKDNKYKVWLTEEGPTDEGRINKNGSNESKFDTIKITDTGSQTFEISIPIKKEHLSSELDNGAEYRIVAYTASNKGMDSILSTNLGDSGILGEGDPDFSKHELPIVSNYISYGTVNDIIKYPKEIIMFEDINGNLYTGMQQVKLIDYPINTGNTNDFPEERHQFKVGVSESTVSMTSSTNKLNTFKANIVNSTGTTINNGTLGILKYTKLNNSMSSNILEFSLKYENTDGKKFYDGETFEGILTFTFEKVLAGGN